MTPHSKSSFAGVGTPDRSKLIFVGQSRGKARIYFCWSVSVMDRRWKSIG